MKMDNFNNNFEKREGDNTSPTPENGGGRRFSQGQYPQPPEWTKNIVVSEKPWIPSGEEGNVSIQFNESEKQSELDTAEENKKPDNKPEWPMWLQIGVVVVAAVIVVLLAKYALSFRTSSVEPTTAPTVAPIAVPSVVTTAPHSTVPAQITEDQTTTEKAEEKTTAPEEEKTTKTDKKNPSLNAGDKKLSEEEIKKKVVEYFNESSNRVKTEATKVIKNFENRTVDEEKLVLPSAIKGVGKSLLEKNFTDITEPVEYPSREAIYAKYPSPGKEWSSKLTADDVVSAACTEKGDEYEITLVLKTCVDPEPGVGASKAIECLNVPMVRETAPEFVTDFSAEYYDCVIRCRVDKATGRVIWSNYTTPIVLKIGLNAGFVEFDAEIGLTFEKDYTVIY